ncbi:aminoglycoside phosphotransferase family protein [Dactylosporangium sp. NPDC050688]|uniref:phosphotransferase enzyme family protein n=1 Tax=Dactylosporangium sp. NPDC050688 TaxID=3157217 RepID=UPI0033DA52A2
MFVEARTRPVLDEICRRLGRSAAEAILLRHHTNAVYAVGDVVVKIAPPGVTLDDLRPVVTVVEWLSDHGFPTVELYPGLDQPFEVSGHVITMWQRLDPANANPVNAAELGTLLRVLHALPAPPIELRRLEPIEGIHRSIATSTILSDEDRQLLRSRLEHLAEAWSRMHFALGEALLQSDPQARNALRRFDGTPVLADWDGASIGPPEWDVATVAVHCRRFAQASPVAFASFTAAYGWDSMKWADFEDLCRLRELKMITTNARKSQSDSVAAREVHRRIAALRSGRDELARWNII